MRLKTSIEDRLKAKRVAAQASYQRRIDEGRCAKCGKPHKPERAEKKVCQRCQAKATDYMWRRRQRHERGRMGIAPTWSAETWNYSTDQLIADHVDLAKMIARRMAPIGPSSLDVDDILGDALYGLVVAGRTYHETYEVPFRVWAAKRIRGSVWDGIRRWKHLKMKEPPVFVALTEAEDGIDRYLDYY